MTRRYRTLLALAAVTLAVTGCASTGMGGNPSGPTAPTGAATTPARIAPGDTAPVPLAMLTCDASPDAPPGVLPQRTWTAVATCPAAGVPPTPDRPAPSPPALVHGDLAPLVAALHGTDAPPASVCPDHVIVIPRFWLVDQDGQAYRPRIPVGPCGQPTDEVLAAMQTLGLR